MCCRVGVALPYRKIQQHLQHLVVAEDLQSEPAEFVQHALSVTHMRVVWHLYSLPLYKIENGELKIESSIALCAIVNTPLRGVSLILHYPFSILH